jgi:tetratricopeptide (TPR) repeat protein
VWYLSAPDLPTLFDRILIRWDEDFGRDPEHPDLVHRSLCLIACARFGLSEAELLDLLGKIGQPLPRRPWTPFYLAAENALAVRAGLLNFGHDHLRTAVRQRWLEKAEAERQFRLQLAGYFAAVTEPTDRKLDELPALLRDTSESERLKDLLVELPTFLRLRSTERWKWELHGLWLGLGERYDPVDVYRRALAETEPNLPSEQLSYVLDEVATFHYDAGRYAGAEPLYRRALEASERVLGPEHSDTLEFAQNRADLMEKIGHRDEARSLRARRLAVLETKRDATSRNSALPHWMPTAWRTTASRADCCIESWMRASRFPARVSTWPASLS